VTKPRALSCPLCAGAVPPPSSTRKVDCPYCGRGLLYEGDDFTPTLVLPPRLGEAEHHQACLKLFKHPLVPSGLSRHATLLRKHRSYLPFYLLTGKRGGVLAVGKERIVTRMPGIDISVESSGGTAGGARTVFRSKTEVEVEEDSRVIVGDFRYAYSAAALEDRDFGDTSLKDVVKEHLGEARAATLDELAADGEVVDADLPLERIVERGVAAGLGTKGELKVLELEASVVYVPVQTFSFRYGRQTFSVTLEELGGTWLGGQLPFRGDWAHLLSVPLVAMLGLVAGNLLGFAIRIPPHEWARSGIFSNAAVLAGLLVGLAMVLGLQAAWLLLRTPLAVRLTPAGPRVERAGEAPRNPFAPANAIVKFMLENAVKTQDPRGEDP
jgi:hypothetical protein